MWCVRLSLCLIVQMNIIKKKTHTLWHLWSLLKWFLQTQWVDQSKIWYDLVPVSFHVLCSTRRHAALVLISEFLTLCWFYLLLLLCVRHKCQAGSVCFFYCLWKVQQNQGYEAGRSICTTTVQHLKRARDTALHSFKVCFVLLYLRHSSLYQFLYNIEKERLDTDTLWQIYVLERWI